MDRGLSENIHPFIATYYADAARLDRILSFGIGPERYLPVRDGSGLPRELREPVVVALPGPVEQTWTRGLNRYLSMHGVQLCEHVAREAHRSDADVVRLELLLDRGSSSSAILDAAILDRKGLFRSDERNAREYWAGRVAIGGDYGHMIEPEVVVFGPIDAERIRIVEQWSPHAFIEVMHDYADFQRT